MKTRDGSFTPSLLLSVGLLVLCLLIITRLKDPGELKSDSQPEIEAPHVPVP